MKDKSVVGENLASALDQRKNEFSLKADERKKRVYSEGIQAVSASGILDQAKKMGDQAVDFELENALGDAVRLSDYLEKGPVILTWYRGGWCPYCNLTLRHMQKALPGFRAQGANLIALTPELPDKSLSTAQKHELEFEVLSDVGNQVARQYGIVFKLTDEVAEIYQQSFDILEYNGDDSQELPLAATYIINPRGKIVYAFLDADYRNRAEPTDILNALELYREG
ncbi:MAG: AhpC/TSA family protein [Cytophagales bacterium]|nr:AhpC/TSA family protein [Cytophagales bacterium]